MQKLNAVLLSRILISSALLLLVAGIAEVYYFRGVVNELAVETNHHKIDAEFSASNVQKLAALESQLESESKNVTRAQQIVSESQSYQFQNQVINDITTYADNADIRISGFVFTETEGEAAASGSGPKRTQVTVRLDQTVPLANYLLLLKYIENNLTKMQVNGITLTPNTEDRNLLDNPTIDLGVYIR